MKSDFVILACTYFRNANVVFLMESGVRVKVLLTVANAVEIYNKPMREKTLQTLFHQEKFWVLSELGTSWKVHILPSTVTSTFYEHTNLLGSRLNGTLKWQLPPRIKSIVKIVKGSSGPKSIR